MHRTAIREKEKPEFKVKNIVKEEKTALPKFKNPDVLRVVFYQPHRL